MRRAFGTLALTASFVSACSMISGLDADYQLADEATLPNDASDANDGATQDANTAPQDGSLPTDGGPCTTNCPKMCGTTACTSCKAIHETHPLDVTGVFSIQGLVGPLTVYCDMVTDDGGWTMVARSASSGAGSSADAGFGWHSADGTPDDETKRYSLGAQRLAFVPTEMLFGSATTGNAWGANVYRVALPTNFVAAQTASAVELAVVAVKGPCSTGGSMHSYAGYTNRTDVFFFRDNNSDSEIHGLKPKGWEANIGNSCSFASEINGLPGMIFVR